MPSLWEIISVPRNSAMSNCFYPLGNLSCVHSKLKKHKIARIEPSSDEMTFLCSAKMGVSLTVLCTII